MKIRKLTENAMPRKEALDKVEAVCDAFLEHSALIGMLGKSHRDYEHWKSELANFCVQLDNIKLKENKKLDVDIFLDNLYHLDTDKDAELDANAAWITHGMNSILDYNFTRQDFHRYKLFRNECVEELAELFADKKDNSKEFFQKFIEDKVNKYF